MPDTNRTVQLEADVREPCRTRLMCRVVVIWLEWRVGGERGFNLIPRGDPRWEQRTAQVPLETHGVSGSVVDVARAVYWG